MDPEVCGARSHDKPIKDPDPDQFTFCLYALRTKGGSSSRLREACARLLLPACLQRELMHHIEADGGTPPKLDTLVDLAAAMSEKKEGEPGYEASKTLRGLLFKEISIKIDRRACAPHLRLGLVWNVGQPRMCNQTGPFADVRVAHQAKRTRCDSCV